MSRHLPRGPRRGLRRALSFKMGINLALKMARSLPRIMACPGHGLSPMKWDGGWKYKPK